VSRSNIPKPDGSAGKTNNDLTGAPIKWHGSVGRILYYWGRNYFMTEINGVRRILKRKDFTIIKEKKK
jgi:hypothetical protein